MNPVLGCLAGQPLNCSPPPALCRYKDCEPLLLTAPNGTQFKFAGVRELLKPGAIAVDTALLPPDAIGEAPAAAGAPPALPPLSTAQVRNQLRLHMRRSVGRYYDGGWAPRASDCGCGKQRTTL